MTAKQGIPFALAVLPLIALFIGCAGPEPGRTSIFVKAPTGTVEIAASQSGTRLPSATPPTGVAANVPPSVAAPVPTVTANPLHPPTATGGTVTLTPEPTEAAGRRPKPTAGPAAGPARPAPAPAPDQTAATMLTPTATPAPTPTLLPTATPTVPPPAQVAELVIQCLFFDGLVVGSESDEYVQILNQGATAVNLMGWQLRDVSDGSPEFTFPSFELPPQASVRVYTNENHQEYGGFSFQRKSPVWNNSSPDTAGLFDPDGASVSTKSYPPGC